MKSRFFGMLIVLFAFMVPIVSSVVATGKLVSLYAVIPMLFVFLWSATQMTSLGIDTTNFILAGLVTLVFGIMLAVLVVVTLSPGVLWCTIVMALVMVSAYRFI